MWRLFGSVSICAAIWVSTSAARMVAAEVDTEATAESELITNVYQVNPNMFNGGQGATGKQVRPSPREQLERLGIKFPPGARVRFDKATSQVTITNTQDEISKFEDYIGAGPPDCWQPQLCIIVERIVIESAFLEAWLLENAIDGDGTALRVAVQKLVRRDEAEVLDTVVVLARSGQRAKVESASESIYPTETDMEIRDAEGRQVIVVAEGERKFSSICPTAYETRNVGILLKVDPVIGADGQTVDLNLVSENVRLDGYLPMPKDGLPPELSSRAPIFTVEEVDTQVTLLHGRYAFLGSHKAPEASIEGKANPVVLNFVRADINSRPE